MTVANDRKQIYTKELVCMNCGCIHTYEVPYGVEWRKHVPVCENCGCSSFSDYYKNIDNFRRGKNWGQPFMATDDFQGIDEQAIQKLLGEKNDRANNQLDCRGVNVEPYNPYAQAQRPNPYAPVEKPNPLKPIGPTFNS